MAASVFWSCFFFISDNHDEGKVNAASSGQRALLYRLERDFDLSVLFNVALYLVALGMISIARDLALSMSPSSTALARASRIEFSS